MPGTGARGVDAEGRDREAGCCAVLYPAVAEAAGRVGATAIGLIGVGRSAGPNLAVDRVGITYDDGRSLGDPSAPEQHTAAVVGDRPIPARPLPDVVTRAAVEHDPIAGLSDALAAVPADALRVVMTTWALSRLRPEKRLRFVDRLEDAAVARVVAWVSVEGVGVAPGVPTLGDRPASGHSIVGLTLFGGPAPGSEALGRCWSRGRWLSWLVDS
ncbi:DUF2332 domain-containing protein [Actinomycetospora endophytica]|uniref:DUF2332 domain-containing protein n=1 Tax=Actinomycetospora endophytica TaxID=2291215 RepID=A0ABS8PAT7_9PSEU|nr:DUF2332 family protein [Actinomycetospora endophytica]MCD2195387.1 DUF2332 domain-containing protein [Actinomycetospora endophytica]